jgi:hypothetical protein
MLRRVVENTVVAVIASLVTWAISNPGDSAGAVDAVIARVLSGVALYGSALNGWLWLTAMALVAVGIALQILSMAPPHPKASWQWSLSMPSLSTTLMGVGVALGLIAKAVSLAEATSLWALPLLAVVVYWTYRWVAGIRYRWTRMAGVL